MAFIRTTLFLFSLLFLGSCTTTKNFFKEPVSDNPFREKLPSMEVVFASICKPGLKEYVIDDFSKNVLQKGDGSNGKIIVYVAGEPNIGYSKFIADYTLFIPFVHFFGLPMYKVDRELSYSALILNKKNDIVKKYTHKSSISFWTNFYNGKKNNKKEDQVVVDIFEAIKSNIKKDLPEIKKAL